MFVVFFFLMIPAVVLAINLKWGQNMKIFGHSDGRGPGIIIIGFLYILGVAMLLLGWKLPAYTMLTLSCIVRPLLYFLVQLPGARYNRKHGRNRKPLEEGTQKHPLRSLLSLLAQLHGLNRPIHGKPLEEGARRRSHK